MAVTSWVDEGLAEDHSEGIACGAINYCMRCGMLSGAADGFARQAEWPPEAGVAAARLKM
ncbi:hypothetical protein [Comamonas flocculans]|uniref:hypothetical protein n=1 Tax=Comamonas flocculans TaxID=2597701 RepID=UPI001647593D|nr:hypothetical protein [Comamonas flocculans]